MAANNNDVYNINTAQSQQVEKESDAVKRLRTLLEQAKGNVKEEDKYRRLLDKQRLKENKDQALKDIKEEYDLRMSGFNKLASAATSLTNSLTSKLDSTIDNYIAKQEAINAHLVGTNANFASLSDTLNSVLGSTSIVKQENVYNNLSKLVNSGIVYNVEQRAFLQTLSEDLGMIFNASDGTLTRMIRLLGDDISANQMSLEYSLQEFLNQNYLTSEYIKQSFSDVANQLIEAQSLMTTSNALTFSGTVQSWLGSYYSAGASSSTISSLAGALNALSSGDVSNLGQGISNLVLMGVARAGLDYGSLLNNNLTGSDVDKIMVGISEYLQEQSNGSNVVMSQLAKLYGINVSDIVAATNLKSETVGGVTSDISELSDISSLMSTGQRIQNRFANAMYTWGTNIASSDLAYTSYMIEGAIAEVGGVLTQIGSLLAENVVTAPVGLALGTAGIAAQNAQLLTLIPSLITTIASGDLFSGGIGSDVSSLFNALGSSSILGSTVKISGSGVSGGMYIGGAGSTNDMLGGMTSSMNDSLGTLGVNGDTEEEEDHIETIDNNVMAIRTEIEAINIAIQEMILLGVRQRLI